MINSGGPTLGFVILVYTVPVFYALGVFTLLKFIYEQVIKRIFK